jgi:hypothetical protein
MEARLSLTRVHRAVLKVEEGMVMVEEPQAGSQMPEIDGPQADREPETEDRIVPILVLSETIDFAVDLI